jgi:DNA-binding NtrC family response regulator
MKNEIKNKNDKSGEEGKMTQTESKTNNLSVLIVDDEEVLCQSVKKVLSRKGHAVNAATTVADALKSLDAGDKYDLIIADLMMPQAGGVELLTAVQASWPDLPVLIITGFSSIASAVETTRLGAAGYLPKPFTPDELEKAVNEVFFRAQVNGKPAETGSDDIIDVDMPFSAKEIEKATSRSYVERLSRSDMPIVAAKPIPAEDFCSLGQRSCKRFLKKGACQQDECPIVAAERKKGRAAASTEYVFDPIDVDMPFSLAEVTALTSEAYAAALGPSDMPVVGHWGQFSPASARKVLVVDDEAVVVNSIRKILTRKGFAIQEAFSCKEALAQVFAQDYDLVLLDMKMSDGNGMDVLQRIKAKRPDLRVVIVTGYASIDTAVEAIQKGASDYMAKPFTPDELYNMTSRVLETKVA